MTKPADFPPPFRTADYVAAPSDPPDERIEVGVLIVGAGPAGLACAIRLGQLLEEAPEIRERLGDVPVAVLEKGKQAGSHLLSGAVVNPRGLRRLFKGRKRLDEMPFYGPVEHESVYFLTRKSAVRIPAPPTMKNERLPPPTPEARDWQARPTASTAAPSSRIPLRSRSPPSAITRSLRERRTAQET
jgi:electron-transferring-flavoprotein dehydrogenase